MGRVSQIMDETTEPLAHSIRAPQAEAPRASRLTARLMTTLMCIALLLVNVLGYGAVWGYNAYSLQKAARSDLNVRVARLQKIASGGKALTPNALSQVKAELAGVDHDLRQLAALLPFRNETFLGPETSIVHAVWLGIEVVDAARAGIDVAQTMAPSTQALLFSATHTDKPTLPAGARPLTMQDIGAAQRALAAMSLDWSAALADRALVSPDGLAALGDPRLGKLLAAFDKYAPTVSVGLSLASALIDWTPATFGLLQPFHMLLFDMDSDELRATGGFLGNYADLTMSNGLLTSGVHLHDIYTLDCPLQVCPTRAVPSQYAWFGAAGDKFGLRDSNLDPSFPASAGLMSSLYNQITGKRVDVVIAITPAIIRDVLEVTGPITVPQYNVTVTADTLNATIHYYHQNPAITARLGIDYGSLGTSVFKAFDVLLSHALMARVASLTGSDQARMGAALVKAFASKDIQVFASNTRVETLLESIGVAGQVLAPDYDNLMVVDTNDGGSYSNSDIQETATDTVTLDSKGNATHSLTINYVFPDVAHLFAQQAAYYDFIRVIVPYSAQQMRVAGPCTSLPTLQSFHAILGCQLSITQGQRATVTFTWTVPHAYTTGAHGAYRLLLQRQAGSRAAWQVIITRPAGGALTPRTAGMRTEGNGATWSASPLVTNTTLTVALP